MQKALFILLACLLCVGKANAQKEANIWYFGNAMTLHFSQDTTEVKTAGNAIQMETACGSICDKNGNLLFYTDGTTAWNAQHQKIKKSDSLKHNASVLIVPKPEQEGVYYLIGVQVMDRFTSQIRDAEPRKNGMWGQKDTILIKDAVLSYSVLDMRKNNGAGEMVQKNVPLMDSCTVDICAIKCENKKDFWLIAHQNITNRYLAYKIDKQGISAKPVVSAVGEVISQNFSNYTGLSSTNKLKASPNGAKIAFFQGFFLRNLFFFDFDKLTGKMSNTHLIKMPSHTEWCTIEFSPNSKKLLIAGMKNSPEYKSNDSRPYIAEIDVTQTHPYEITRYAQRVFVEYVPKDKTKYFSPRIENMQLAPNGKIYATIQNYNAFDMIVLHNPNAPTKDYKVQFSYPLPKNALGNFPHCTHLLPNEAELSTAFAVGKIFTRDILFDTNQYTFKPEHEKDLQDILAYLTKNPKTTIEISGHTDNEGEETKNKTLSENRAKALANFLISKQVGKERVKAIGYGSSKPIADNATLEGKAKNRRIEFLITEKK